MLFVVRHGQTAANAGGLLLGRADPPLTAVGVEQAAALAAYLPRAARVVTSPLARTRATADAFGRSYEVDERWIELDYGDLDGVPVRDVPAEVWGQWRADPSFIPGGGESLAALGVRVRAACQELLDEVRDHDVVVVTHVSPIKAAISWALGAGDDLAWRILVEVASIARIGVDQFGPAVRSLNEHPAVTSSEPQPRLS
jgi:broad specificity phosphatase PhoE